VVQVWADIAYTDQTGRRNITKPATVQASGKTKHKLTDAEKQKCKIEHAKCIIRRLLSLIDRRSLIQSNLDTKADTKEKLITRGRGRTCDLVLRRHAL
jgi:hypothetical protein